jgi:hypothetical protein
MPHHGVDSMQLQLDPILVTVLPVAPRGVLVKQPRDTFFPQFLASSHKAAGNNQGAVTKQKDIWLIGRLSHRNVAEDGHTDNDPN